MELKVIEEKIRGRKGAPMGVTSNYAVLLPLIYINGELNVIYEVRSMKLDTQPGEVSFPGGGVEEGESFRDAAIRETCEELSIDSDNVRVIGELDYIVSPYNFILYPFVGVIEGISIDEIEFSKDEVERLFTVSLSYLLNNDPLLHLSRLKTVPDEEFPYHMIQNGENYNWREGKYPVYFYNYGKEVIWGMTARITKNFVNILKKKHHTENEQERG